MIDVGMAEDPNYTKKALQYLMTFDDVLKLSNEELAEVLSIVPPRLAAIAINQATAETKNRFLSLSKPPVRAAIQDFLSLKVGLREIGGAQLKLVESTRQLERKGLIRTKHIPLGGA